MKIKTHSFVLRVAGDVTIDCWWRHNDQTIVTRTYESDIWLIGYRFYSRRYSRLVVQEMYFCLKFIKYDDDIRYIRDISKRYTYSYSYS